jgi:nitrogen fixation NifU-like protein
MYSEKVIDHFMNPRNVGEITDANGIGQVGNPKCGDIMKMYLKIVNDVIIDAKFKTFGCGAAVATSSMATELVIGKTIDEALKITNKIVAEALDGLPPPKMHCSSLAEEAIKLAIEDYKAKKSKNMDKDNTDKNNSKDNTNEKHYGGCRICQIQAKDKEEKKDE